MRVFINRKPVAGPWGGGTKLLHALIVALGRAGHDVTHDLDADIDVLLCFDPRPALGMVGYQEMLAYARASKRRVVLVQRVGDIGTHGKPDLQQLVIASTACSTTSIFPSRWAHDSVQHLHELADVRLDRQWHVVPNAPMVIFHDFKFVKNSPPPEKKISFVTHHWSDNPKKGFEFYAQLHGWCQTNGHTFTFIGRAPLGVPFKPQGPMSEHELVKVLPQFDVYVTASLEEAGANHVLEAAACGLPIIYHQGGGSIVEYCGQFGTSFDGTIPSFERALSDLRAVYPKVRRALSDYKTTVDDVAQIYVAIIEGLVR